MRSPTRSAEALEKVDPGLIIFDKDGTLIDFNLMWGAWIEKQAWMLEMSTGLPLRNELFATFGYDWLRRAVLSTGALFCRPMNELRDLAVDTVVAAGVGPGGDRQAAEELVDEHWEMPDAARMSRPLGDLTSVFQMIQGFGLKIAVCTADNRAPTTETLEVLGVDGMVDAICCGDDGFAAKPSPEQIWKLCNDVGVQPCNALMVGDTATDMTMGRDAGCGLTIGVLGGAGAAEDLADTADVLLPRLEKLTKIVFQFSTQTLR